MNQNHYEKRRREWQTAVNRFITARRVYIDECPPEGSSDQRIVDLWIEVDRAAFSERILREQVKYAVQGMLNRAGVNPGVPPPSPDGYELEGPRPGPPEIRNGRIWDPELTWWMIKADQHIDRKRDEPELPPLTLF